MARQMEFLTVIVLIAIASAAWADWNVGDPAKWVQLPQLDTLGIDVNASWDYILADDFECTEPGRIIGIHIWGSWLDDYLPSKSADSVRFVLSIHADIPDSESVTGYSMPGDVLWYRTFDPGDFTSRVWAGDIEEGWLSPPVNYTFPADWTCWQYNFAIPEEDSLFQYGTPDEPIVYWLDVKAIPFDTGANFGWKTSLDHWNDDAVWAEGFEPDPSTWIELRYPPGHRWVGASIDLAFALVGEYLDWGDAPDLIQAPWYPTLSAHNGARHVIGGPWLGDDADAPDSESDGQPEGSALGDDNLDGNDDEDGIVVYTLTQGDSSTLSVEVNDGGSGTGGVVEAWIDFDGDHVWQAGEQIFTGWLPAGTHAIDFVTPSGAIVGQTFGRFRISLAGGLSPDGPAPDGEVEDYEIHIQQAQTWKWQQRPDITQMGIDVEATEDYILADDFECTETGRITEIWIWGAWLNDYLPWNDPEKVDFTLSFHADIPADWNPDGYSIPGNVLWHRDFPAGDFEVYMDSDSIWEGWMTPPGTYIFPANQVLWRYVFHINGDAAFLQEGTPTNPIVYWLDVQADPLDFNAVFGWKSTPVFLHWNDDAVWARGAEPYPGPWYELRYPPGHPSEGASIDLAFRLINDPLSGVPDKGGAESFGLFQNVPNPFSASTGIRYSLQTGGHVNLDVYDVTGRLVATLVDEAQPGGLRTATWSGVNDDGRQMPAGIYFYRLTSANRQATRKMLYLK